MGYRHRNRRLDRLRGHGQRGLSSFDRGATWQASGLEGQRIDKIAARPGAEVVLAVGGSSLYASRDRGESWAPLSAISYARTVGIDPDQPSIMYAGYDHSIWKSTDAGANWQSLPAPGDPPWPEAFAFSSGAVYVLSYGRLFKSTDGGISWSSAQPPVNSVGAIAAGAVDGVIYASSWDGFCRSADSAATWTCLASSGFDSILEIPSPTAASPRILASRTTSHTNSRGTTVRRETFLSRDGGATWAPAGGGLEGPVTAFTSDAAGTLVLAGTYTQVFRSEDRGDTWTPFRAGLNAVLIGALALDPQNSSTIWAGGIGNYPSGPGLFRSTDTGLSWSSAGELPGAGSVRALLIDPENPRTMYAFSYGILHRTKRTAVKPGRFPFRPSVPSSSHWTPPTTGESGQATAQGFVGAA